MAVIIIYYVDLLKAHVLEAAGYKTITPADCRVLAELVAYKTKQSVSETTLKRLYGFALSKFNPSLFTLDVLSRYCGYTGWDNFCSKNEQQNNTTENTNVDWLALQNSINKITYITLQALKNRSGIPYHLTIKRNFINHHMDDFLDSSYTGTLLSAPAGYGKTIALCHWIDEKLQLIDAGKSNDIILFLSSSALTSVLLSGKDINSWMLALLGYSPNHNVNILFDIEKRKAGNFYLIIDGFDGHMFKAEQFRVILNQLIDIFSFYQLHNWFKLVLTMRSASWINSRHSIDSENNSWFTNFKSTDAFYINMPLFSISEINSLCHNINPAVQNSIAFDVAESLNHPLYFQFYYKQHKNDFSLNKANSVSIYDIISMFIFNKIYLGSHSAEKILFIKALVDEMDILNHKYNVSKLKINPIIKKYYQAYQELLSVGFIRELNESDNYQYNAYIQFASDSFLEHSIAKTLLYQHNELLDFDLIQHINALFVNNPHKMPVIKWCIIHAIKTGQQNSFEKITEFNLSSNEKSNVLIFLGELLEQEFTNKNELLIQYFKQDFNDKLFNYFFGLELVNINYHKTFKTLLKFKLSSKKRILIYMYLAMGAIIKLDMDELNTHLLNLKAFSVDEYQSFTFNPLTCLDTLYHYLKYGNIKKQALRELTKLYFTSAPHAEHVRSSTSADLLYILGFYTILLANNPKKTIRFINFIDKTYKPANLLIQSTPYGFFMMVAIADTYYKLGEHDKVSAIYYSISEAYKKSDNMLTPYMKSLFHCLKIKMLINTDRETDIFKEMKCVNAITEESGYQFSKLYIQTLLLNNQRFMAAYPEFQKQISYSATKLIRDKELNINLMNNAHLVNNKFNNRL